MQIMEELVFLKLGGSLITEKTQRYTPRLSKLKALAHEIREAMAANPSLRLILGHGSGSFGHFAVREHLDATALGGSTDGNTGPNTRFWMGFAQVWYRASQLNRHVVEACHEAGMPVISLAPSATVTTAGDRIVSWDLSPLRAALDSGLVPMVYGDVVFDQTQGGRVLSTESLLWHLAHELKPKRILLAGLEQAVWADFPDRSTPIGTITPATLAQWTAAIGGSDGTDVTGGMRSKVIEMLDLVQAIPGLTVRIFSGDLAGNVARAVAGDSLGTLITCD